MKLTLIGVFTIVLFLGTSFIPLPAQESQEIGQTPALTDKPLEIWTFIDDYRFITGKILHLTVQVIWKLGVTVNLEDIDTMNLQPFKIESVTVGERQIFDNEHDYLIITYALSLPSDLKNGIYSIPSFSLSYRNEVDKTEGNFLSSPVAIQKTPILVQGKIDKDVITIGDRIAYTLTVRHEKNVKLLWENIEKLNFSPFEVLKRDIEKQAEGNIEKTIIHYTLSLYELGGKKKVPEIPALSILYYAEPGSPHNVKTDISTIETKEAQTVPLPVVINSLLKTVDIPLEGIKGPLYLSPKQVFLHGCLPIGLGGILLLILGGITVRSTMRKFPPVTAKSILETPKIALERLKNSLASFQFTDEETANRKSISEIDKALRGYVGLLIGISPEIAQSVTTSGFMGYDVQKKLSEETSTLVHTVLRKLDTLIFGTCLNKETTGEVIKGIEEIIARTDSKFLR